MVKSEKIAGALAGFKSVDLSILPTPLHKMENISRETGKSLYCKRDDLTGFAYGGNKTRKLDYLIKDALDKQADCIVTFGSNQSNWCRMASAAGISSGMDVFMILDGARPGRLTGNLVLDYLVGAKIEYINNNDPSAIERAAHSRVSELRNIGREPYYLPVGGSVPVGALGYIKAFKEIIDYSEISGIAFHRIFVATGSAGTQAGLICGQVISGWEGEIIGVSVGRGKIEQEEMVTNLVSDTLSLLMVKADTQFINELVIVDDNYYGEGYRINSSEAGQAIELFARREGIFLDEVYTGKAAAGLIDYARKGIIKDHENILFIHTGGGIQLFE